VRIGGGFVLRPAQDFGVGAAEQVNQLTSESGVRGFKTKKNYSMCGT
jgi:hypothetical protein